MHVAQINVYPIKSLGGVSLQSCKTLENGLEHDRVMMLVDNEGVFVSQRSSSKLATLGVRIESSRYTVFQKSRPENHILIPFQFASDKTIKTSIWNTEVESKVAPSAVNEWFSEYLGKEVRLVRMENKSSRHISFDTKPFESDMSFADGYPFLFLSRGSVQHVSSKIAQEVDIRQFRANVIFDDCDAFAEDSLKEFSIGDASFNMIKPCKRCQVIGINQDSGISSNEPIKYLSKTRKEGNHIIFGMNAALLSPGIITVNDNVNYKAE